MRSDIDVRSDNERLAVIEELLLRLEERLFGNGQPGEIALLKDRVRKLEAWFWRGAGAAAVLATLSQWLDIARIAAR